MSHIDLAAAESHFTEYDPVMHRLLTRARTAPAPIAVPTPKQENEYFKSIVTSIISQQISTKAAEAVRARVEAFLGEVTPERVQSSDKEALRACGLSGQKVRYIRHNAEIWGDVPINAFSSMSDEEVISELTKLYGIGRWTAEMFLMFSLARPNVFSYGDLGLMNSLYREYNYHPHYTKKIRDTVNSWSPHKTAASLALWHTTDNGPVIL